MKLTVALYAAAVAALNPSCAPGGNFDLSHWSLQEPVGDSSPRQIPSSQLQHCDGYHDAYFFTAADGSMAMKVPSRDQCVTTPNSQHCRSELREQSPATWDPKAATNRLFAEVQAIRNDGEVCVGQIHIYDAISHKPVAELYLNAKGELNLGVQQCRTCSQKRSPVTKLGSGKERFTYEIRYEKGKLSVAINGGGFKEFTTYDLDSPKSYFKAGNYNQGTGPTEVHFYQLKVSH
ncbi:Alginate lyase 2 [Cordyceps militaris CM01]|uniref:Alginate lyase 2 n=1 Tax=Cordyceps militaris (strain CM01) TaxID=983644 RepID=G3J5Q0_CORMM|nr:Alginate lyase 2 [Cordyceps militaris CM01]EGX96057.1 Alginate lyase 2 [Cordyceps militaris CM01]